VKEKETNNGPLQMPFFSPHCLGRSTTN